jgi:hypothetical protein
MKNLFLALIFLVAACAPAAQDMDKEEKPSKYKKGDIVCVIEFNVKGIVQYENFNFSGSEPVYNIMFNSKDNLLYNLNIYESQLSECQ